MTAPTPAEVLAAIRSGLTDPDKARASLLGHPTPGHAHAAAVAQQARLHRGQWADIGNGLQVKLG